MDAYKFKAKGSAYADRMTAGYSHTEWHCPACKAEILPEDEFGAVHCSRCDEDATPVMVTKYGRFPR